jgi:uncharacterized protein (DUF302 family)
MKILIALLLGIGIGAAGTLGAVKMLTPDMMIVTRASTQGFDETVTALEGRIKDLGWSHSATLDMNEKMSKAGVELDRKVKVVQLCKPDYAGRILASDPNVSCLMPCAIGVWEDGEGDVHISKMNTGLMGKLFGGEVAEVMGGMVAGDEEKMLSGLAAD